MSDLVYDDPGSPIYWELMSRFGPKFLASPWSPEFLETDPEPGEDEIKVRNFPVTFDAALAYTRRLVAAQELTMEMPILALDRYAQEVDLDSTQIAEIIEGVLVHD